VPALPALGDGHGGPDCRDGRCNLAAQPTRRSKRNVGTRPTEWSSFIARASAASTITAPLEGLEVGSRAEAEPRSSASRHDTTQSSQADVPSSRHSSQLIVKGSITHVLFAKPVVSAAHGRPWGHDRRRVCHHIYLRGTSSPRPGWHVPGPGVRHPGRLGDLDLLRRRRTSLRRNIATRLVLHLIAPGLSGH